MTMSESSCSSADGPDWKALSAEPRRSVSLSSGRSPSAAAGTGFGAGSDGATSSVGAGGAGGAGSSKPPSSGLVGSSSELSKSLSSELSRLPMGSAIGSPSATFGPTFCHSSHGSPPNEATGSSQLSAIGAGAVSALNLSKTEISISLASAASGASGHSGAVPAPASSCHNCVIASSGCGASASRTSSLSASSGGSSAGRMPSSAMSSRGLKGRRGPVLRSGGASCAPSSCSQTPPGSSA